MPAPAAAAAAAPQAIPKMLPKFFHQYVGNPVLFQFLKPYEHIPAVKFLNNVYNTAPASKWSLSIVPLYGVLSGNSPPEKIDMNTSGSLACTGFVWTIYALMIQPQNSGSRALAAVNFCMGSVNGYKCYKKKQYLDSLKK
eukprot:GILI01011534.1.p1 GENE.GILI01011534.1~~GILI01011534.1.p1  ORF type:complete len:140 (+),score=24.25 GILI01011534.1:47-466(+)